MSFRVTVQENELLAGLTDRQREFFTLHVAGCSKRTIARVYGCSTTNVRDILESAERKIAKARQANGDV